MAYFNERLTVAVLRWTARIISVALFILIAFITITEGVPNPFAASLKDNLLGVAFSTMTVGLLVGWKWEGIGGLLILGWATVFAVLNHDYGDWPNVLTVVWLVTGLLYLACWWRTSRCLAGEEPKPMELGPITKVLKCFWIPLVLVLAHATLVILTAIDIALSADPEAGMVWIIFNVIDCPMSSFFGSMPTIFLTSRVLFGLPVLLLGTIQWGIIGLVLQGIVYSLRHGIDERR